MRLKEIKPGMVVHCKTQEEANILCDTICNKIVEKSKWKGFWVNYRESTCYKISNAGFYSYGRIASYKDSNITEFSDLILQELTAEEVWNGLGDVEDDEIYEYFQQPCLFETRDELILRADWKDLVAIVEKHIADHEKKEPKEKGKAPCMIIFCSFQQIPTVIKYAEKHGFKNYIPLVFIKNYSAQVLKANMKIVGATEYGLVLYRDKLPKFNNNGRMIFNWMFWERDGKEIPKIHPTQKPVGLLKKLIEIYTDPGDVVIDPCAGSGSTLRASMELGRDSYGFEIHKPTFKLAKEEMLSDVAIREYGQIPGQSSLFDFPEVMP